MLTQLKKEMTFIDKLPKSKVIGGIELANPDEAMMNYLNLWAKEIPVKEFRFVHVVPSIEFFAFGNETNLELDDALIQPLQKAISETFKGTKAGKAYLEIKVGDSLDQILAEVAEEDATLVVIGQKKDGHHNIKARRIARRAECSVLVVPEEAKLSMDNVLVPIDFSENSKNALLTALDIREKINPNAKITLLYVYELPNFSSYKISRQPEALQKDMREDRKEALNNFLESMELEDSYNIDTKIIEKNNPGIAHYLLEYADEDGVDLIVMGAKGHSAIENFLLGSVAENLLTQNHKIPTLLVRPS